MNSDLHESGALRGITVLDLSRVLGGPYCTQILGDHGANIIKVEPPTGDDTRAWGPPFTDGSAAYFEGVNRNKRCIALDLNSEEDLKIVFELLEHADVLVQNFKPRSLKRWGLEPDRLQERYPHLVQCWVTGFGEDGPLGGLPGYDAVAQAMSGLMSVNGEAGGAPTRIGVPVIDLVTGLHAALGVMFALRDRELTGKGQIVEAALYDTGLSLLHPYIANYLRSGVIPSPAGSAHPNITPYDRFDAQDGPIFIAAGNDAQFQALCRVAAAPDVASDSRFQTNELRNQNRDTLKSLLEKKFSALDKHTIVASLTKAGVPCGCVQNVKEALEHAHTIHRGMIVSLDGYTGVASPIKLSRSKATYRYAPPKKDENREEILASLPEQIINKVKKLLGAS